MAFLFRGFNFDITVIFVFLWNNKRHRVKDCYHAENAHRSLCPDYKFRFSNSFSFGFHLKRTIWDVGPRAIFFDFKSTFFITCASPDPELRKESLFPFRTSKSRSYPWVAIISAKNHKRQRRKRQSVTAKQREKSQTPKVLTAILTLPNLT